MMVEKGLKKIWEQNDYQQVYMIYGAGVVGYYLSRYMLKLGYRVSNFIVKCKEKNLGGYFEIPVFAIDEIKCRKQTPVIVATLERLHEQIIKDLCDAGFETIYCITDSEYLQIRQAAPDNDAEMFFQARNTACLINNFYHDYIKFKNHIDIYSYEENLAMHNAQYRNDFSDFRLRSDFEEKLFKLIEGMDENSKDEVLLIIHRLNLLCEGKEIVTTKVEQERLQELCKNYEDKVFNIGNKIIYKDFIMPGNAIVAAPVFYYRNGIDAIINKAYIGDKSVIDAGGYVGDSAVVFAREFGGGEIHTFEFEEKNISMMNDVLKWNHVRNVIPVQMALTDQCGEMTFNIGCEDICDYNSIYRFDGIPYHDCVVKTITIDEYVEKNHLQVGLIKMDIEGAERLALRGAVNTIQMQMPILLISIYHSIEDFFEIKPMIEAMTDKYMYHIFRPVLRYSFLEETLLICEPRFETGFEDRARE